MNGPLLAWVLALGPGTTPPPPPPPPPARPRNLITWQPLSLISGYVDLEYERAFGRWVSVYAAPGGIFSHTQQLDGSTSVGLYAASLDVGARVFAFGAAPTGFLIDLGAGVATSQFGEFARYQGFGARGMLLLGYTFILAEHLAVSLGGGVQVTRFTTRGSSDADTQVLPALRVAVGAAF